MRKRKRVSAIAAALIAGIAGTGLAAGDPGGSQWTSAGGNVHNTRYQSTEHTISVDNVAQLGVKWAFTTGGDVSATPAVDGSKVYVPDWAGNLYAVDRETGQQVWSTKIAAASGVPGDKARATPVVASGKVIVGTQGPFGGGGRMLAYDKDTGALLWSTVLDSHLPRSSRSRQRSTPAVSTSASPRSRKRSHPSIPGYPCCSFRGSMLALDLETGAIIWKTIMVPEGYPGGAIWGSSPSIDPSEARSTSRPATTTTSPRRPRLRRRGRRRPGGAARLHRAEQLHRLDPRARPEDRGNPLGDAALPFDAWTVQCIFGSNPENCPEPAGPDYDFGQAPALFTVKPSGNGQPRDLVGAGQKSGQFWALDPDTGEVQWVTVAGPGGTAGGLQWGSAVDGVRVYTANANSDRKPWEMPGRRRDLRDVERSRRGHRRAPLADGATHGGSTSGPATTANGVVFGCSLDPQGHMYALNGATGAVLWEFASGGSCLSGAAISNGTVYWGSGYTNFGFGTPNNKLYAFELQ